MALSESGSGRFAIPITYGGKRKRSRSDRQAKALYRDVAFRPGARKVSYYVVKRRKGGK